MTDYSIGIDIEERENTLCYDIEIETEESCDGQSFDIDDVKNAWKYIQESFEHFSEIRPSKKMCEDLSKMLLDATKNHDVYYQIEAIPHQYPTKHFGLYSDLNDVWEHLLEWDLPADHTIDVYNSKEELDDFIESIDREDLKLPEYNYPITVCMRDGFYDHIVIEKYDMHSRNRKEPLNKYLKEFLVDAHFDDYQSAKLYKIKNHKKQEIDWLADEK